MSLTPCTTDGHKLIGLDVHELCILLLNATPFHYYIIIVYILTVLSAVVIQCVYLEQKLPENPNPPPPHTHTHTLHSNCCVLYTNVIKIKIPTTYS